LWWTWKLHGSGTEAMINAKKVWVCWRMIFGEDRSAAGDKNCRPYYPTESWNYQCYCLTECDTVQSTKCISTLHRTDCSSYIFTTRWSRGSGFFQNWLHWQNIHKTVTVIVTAVGSSTLTFVIVYPITVWKFRNEGVCLSSCEAFRTELRFAFSWLLSGSRSRQEFLCFRNFSTGIRD
jgi:hypothetical protein